MTASSARSSRLRYSRRVLSAKSPRRRAITTARSSSAFRGEDGIPGLDGELAIAQLVSQADLPVRRMSLLGAVEIGNPDRRTVSCKHFGDDTSAATFADDVDHHLVVLEHPVPAGAAVDTHRGLVRADDTRATQPGQDVGHIRIELRLAPAEGGIERAFADAKAEQFEQQTAQSPVADGVHEAQIHRYRDDVEAERRAWFQPLGQRGERDAAAARALPGVMLHPRHHGRDCRQVDLVITAMEGIIATRLTSPYSP